MDIIRTRQKNWIGHIRRGDSTQRETMEGNGERPREKHMDLDDGRRIREAQRQGTTMGGKKQWTFAPAGRQKT